MKLYCKNCEEDVKVELEFSIDTSRDDSVYVAVECSACCLREKISIHDYEYEKFGREEK